MEALATSLGANLEQGDLLAQRDEMGATIEELQQLIAAKPELSVIFASYGEPGTFNVAAPDYVADLGYLRGLGLTLANDGSPTATSYWGTLSTEQALLYPSDVVYLDSYGAWNTLEMVQEQPTISQHPAIPSGQVGSWNRDYPFTYTGIASFLEDVLEPRRTAEKVS